MADGQKNGMAGKDGLPFFFASRCLLRAALPIRQLSEKEKASPFRSLGRNFPLPCGNGKRKTEGDRHV
ncbi:hypothetical protein [Geobacillus thermodenitrificans]|uniref:hypothetical protein n=1 Tax=Geobacillus thermodenitrificans TaxID=33940 RepID=UPI002E1A2471|nr:hypothetical protein [Geobacillus thermodenitrificans]MED3905752.1 hypothetical protein [Geobacillus thermodenitrificans]